MGKAIWCRSSCDTWHISSGTAWDPYVYYRSTSNQLGNYLSSAPCRKCSTLSKRWHTSYGMVVLSKSKAETKNVNCRLVFHTRGWQSSNWTRNDMGRKRPLRRALFARVPNATVSQMPTLWTLREPVPCAHQVRSLRWRSPVKKLLG